jgi:hypothetical protein
VAHTPLGRITPEQWRDERRTFEQVIAELAAQR